MKTFKKTVTVLAFASLSLATAATAAQARDQIRIVGSSTVFPFATAVAENFGKSTEFKTPVVESTGSGGGLKLFCEGVGIDTPDITNASRRIKTSEIERCAKNGVTDIVEIKIGYDGIVIGNSASAPQMNITKKQIFLALAKDVPDANGNMVPNPYKMWNEIDPSLPAVKIEVLGPPPTSGTRDAFVELAMEGGAKKFDMLKALKKSDKKAFKAIAHSLREDGAFIEAGENDNLIVQKLVANPDAFGIFGFSFLDQNADKIQGTMVNGVAPEFDAIADSKYGVSRSLFFYVKTAHVGTVPGIEAYLAEFSSEKTWGEEGYLTDKGLIPMPAEERAKYNKAATSLSPLSM